MGVHVESNSGVQRERHFSKDPRSTEWAALRLCKKAGEWACMGHLKGVYAKPGKGIAESEIPRSWFRKE